MYFHLLFFLIGKMPDFDLRNIKIYNFISYQLAYVIVFCQTLEKLWKAHLVYNKTYALTSYNI